MQQCKHHSGFTMLELSIVIVIIALITGMSTVATLGLVETAKQSATERKLDEIERALQTFRNKNNRLPCPANFTLASTDSNYGLEGQPLGGCGTGTPAAAWLDSYGAEGVVPVRTLGLPDSFMYDGWGRRIRYMVDTNATYSDAFTTIKPNEFCEITILDNTGGNAITGNSNYENGAVYALLSHGANGHGGYTETGAIVNAGSADGSEQINCRCDASGVNLDALEHANYVQKEATSTFDDIVRYKERWQMQNDDDAKLISTYTGPDMAISLTQNGSNNIKFFERQCGQLKEFPGTAGLTLPTNFTSTSTTVGLAFAQNNAYVFSYNNDTDAYCDLYSIVPYGRVGPSDTGSTGLDCSTYGASPVIDMSQNGYLFISQSSSPYIKFWRFSNSKFIEEISTPLLSTTPSTTPTKIAVSKNGNYLALSGAAYTYVYYKNTTGTYTRMSNPVLLPAGTTIANMAFSPDEKYLATAVNSSTTVYIWTITETATPSLSSSPTRTLTDGVSNKTILKFSPDGKYFVSIGGNPAPMVAFNSHISLYKVDGSYFTLLSISPGSYTYGGGPFNDAAFSSDSHFLVLPYTNGSSDQRAMVFKRTGVNTFKENAASDGTAMPLTFSLNASEHPYRVRFAY